MDKLIIIKISHLEYVHIKIKNTFFKERCILQTSWWRKRTFWNIFYFKFQLMIYYTNVMNQKMRWTIFSPLLPSSATNTDLREVFYCIKLFWYFGFIVHLTVLLWRLMQTVIMKICQTVAWNQYWDLTVWKSVC